MQHFVLKKYGETIKFPTVPKTPLITTFLEKQHFFLTQKTRNDVS